jgi:hypothetical protein
MISPRLRESEAARDRYANQRARIYDAFRTKLVRGEVALPHSPKLEAELRTCRGFTNSSGKLQIISKAEWRGILAGRSPARLDGVVMAIGVETHWFSPVPSGMVP